ncbi:MAG: glycosyltransferase [Lewinellaceae bacterium]|nr:glycosyltransferase [Lewinellaceae bacterium]
MRIVFITHYTDMLGANRSLLHLILQLTRKHNVTALVLCPGTGPLTEVLEKEGIDFQAFPFSNAAYTIFSLRLYAFFLLRLHTRFFVFPRVLRAVAAFNPDVIHSNTSVVHLGWRLSEKLKKPHVWHIREFGWSDYKLVFPYSKAFTKKKMAAASAVICISRAIESAWQLLPQTPEYVLFNGVGTLSLLQSRMQPEASQKRLQSLIS